MNITTWQPLRELTSNVRSMYIRCLAEILKADTIEKVKLILSAVFKIATSQSVGKAMVNGQPSNEDTPAENARKVLKNLISNVAFEEECNPEEVDIESSGLESIPINNDERNSPFKIWCLSVLEDNDQSNGAEGEHESAHYCPKIVPYILDLLKDMPLVTWIMVPIFRHGKVTASSARIESGFKDLKHVIFKDDQLPLRADVFLRKHILTLEGQLKLFASQCRIGDHEIQPTFDHNEINPMTKIHQVDESAFTCIKCRKYVNTDDVSCYQSLDDKSQVMCGFCLNDGASIENSLRENWKGLGFTPIKKPPPSCDMKRPTKRMNFEDEVIDQTIKRLKSKSITSYLVRKPEVANMDISGKSTLDVGLLKMETGQAN